MRGVVLVHHDPLGAAEIVERGVLQLEADLLRDHLAAGEHRDVAEHLLAAVTEARRLDGGDLQGAPELVHHQRGERLALDVLRDDQEGPAALGHLLQHREELLHRRDLLVVDEDVGVVQHRLHLLRIGDEVGRQVTAVELHAVHGLQGGLEALGLFDGDDAVLAHLLHRLGDQVADLAVVVGGDGADLGDLLLAGRGDREALERLGDGLDGPVDAPLQLHRVGAGGDVLEALAEDRLGQHGGGGGAVAGEVGGLGGDLLHHLGAHVLDRVGQLDFLGHRHAVLGDGRRAELLVDDDIPALGTEGDLHRLGEVVDAPLELGAGIGTEKQLLRSHLVNLLGVEATGRNQPSLASTSDALMMTYSSPS